MEFLEKYINIIVFVVPVIIGLIEAKRSNILYGLVSVFITSYFICFVSVDLDMFGLVDLSQIKGLQEALVNMQNIMVLPIVNMFKRTLDYFNLESFSDAFFANMWYYFAVMVVISVIISLASSEARRNKIGRHQHRITC